MADRKMCVSSGTLGIQHPYSYCVKPTSEMVPTQFTEGGLGMKNTGKVLGGLFSYVEYLTVNANAATANICKDNRGKGVIGNKYVLKTNIKCRRVNSSGATISGDYYLHKYIDNTTTLGGLITGGRPMPDVNGLVPSTFASAGKIGGNVMDIITAFSGDTNPYCMAVNMKCHVIQYNNKKKTTKTYKGFSEPVYLSLDDIDGIDAVDFQRKPTVPVIQTEEPTPTGPTAPFTTDTTTTTPGLIPPRATPRDGFTNVIDNIIQQNADKIQSPTDFESLMNQINFQDEFLIKTYYVGFSILIIILIFKLINKK
jgi:hypothetical protein